MDFKNYGRAFIICFTGIIALACVEDVYPCGVGTPKAIISSPSDGYVGYIGQTINFDGSNSYDTDEGGASIETYEWYADMGGPVTGTGATWSHSYDDPTSELYPYEVVLKIHDDEGQLGLDYCDIYIQAVKSIEMYAPQDGWTCLASRSVTGSITILKGTKYEFRAVECNMGKDWPTGPTWSGVASGTGETITAEFDTTGSHTLTCKCGPDDSGVTVDIEVVEPSVAVISFIDASGVNNQHNIKDIQGPQWTWDSERTPSVESKEVAYTKDTKISLAATFDLKGAQYIPDVSINVYGQDWLEIPTLEWDFNTAQAYWNMNPLGTTSFFESLTNLPDSVGVTNLHLFWEYEVEGLFGTGNPVQREFPTMHHIYRLMGAPTYPQAEPWKEVLDKSCSWAMEESDEVYVIGSIVDEIYNSGFKYENVWGHNRYEDGGYFKLTTCLSEWGDPYTINCWDCVNMVAIFSNALGCNLDLLKIESSEGSFLLNYIKPIGRSWTNDPSTLPGRQGFSYHYVAWSEVYDACLQVDADGDPTTTGCVGEQPHNMTFNAQTPGIPYDDYRGLLADPSDEEFVNYYVPPVEPAAVK